MVEEFPACLVLPHQGKLVPVCRVKLQKHPASVFLHRGTQGKIFLKEVSVVRFVSCKISPDSHQLNSPPPLVFKSPLMLLVVMITMLLVVLIANIANADAGDYAQHDHNHPGGRQVELELDGPWAKNRS